MANPCDFSVCDPDRCSDVVCSGFNSDGEPSVGFVIEPIESFEKLSQAEKAAYIRGANQYSREVKAKKE